MDALSSIRAVVADRHRYAQEWRARTAGKVVGYMCTYVPEEIIYAAGLLPVRVLGSHQPQDVSERHIFDVFCPFCRDVLAQGLRGRYDYLSGLVKARSCMHMRNAFSSWVMHLPLEFSHYVFVPANIAAPAAKAMLYKELKAFQKALEEWRGCPITQEDLERATAIYNANRRLLRQLYWLRQREPPLLSGKEAMEAVLSAQLMDKAESNLLLSQLLAELAERGGGGNGGPRLMLLGTENDDLELLELMESLPSTVVIEDHCTGSRYFWNEAPPDPDPLMAIARRYLERPRCPAKDLTEPTRPRHIAQLIKDYRVQGAVIMQQKFCEPMEHDIPVLIALLQEKGLPYTFFEYDLATSPAQVRTRVEALLEMIELGV